LSAGVQALAARRLGEGRADETAIPLNGGLILAVLIGVPLTVVCVWLAPLAFDLLTRDPAVAEQGIPYLQVRLLAMVAVGVNFSFRGYWSAIHQAGLYLRTLLIMHSINIFLNWVLIFGNLGAPAMGVYGAGLATTIALYVGSLIYLWFAWRHARDKGFLHRPPTRATLWQQFRISLPASLQQQFFAIGMLALIWIVSRIGTAEVAAVNVLMTINLTALLPAFGVSLACTTLVGNALGRGDKVDAARWGWNAAVLTGVYGTLFGLLVLPFSWWVLGVFLTNPETQALAWPPMMLWALFLGLDIAGMVLMNALVGAGDTRRSMWISIVWQWAVFLPVAYLVGPVLGLGLLGVWAVMCTYRTGQAVHAGWVWRQRRWAEIVI
jgi:putative MATE family efflux protein